MLRAIKAKGKSNVYSTLKSNIQIIKENRLMSAIEAILQRVAERQSRKPKNKREQNRYEARQRLVDAWRELYVAGEHTQTPIGELAKKAEVSVGTFYALFSDRDELTQDTAVDSVSRMIDGINNLTWDSDTDAYARARATFEFVLDFAERCPMEMLFFLRLSEANTPEAKAFVNVWDEFWESHTREALAIEYERVGAEIPFDTRVALRASHGMVVEVLDWWLTEPDSMPREELADSLTRLILWGLMPR